MELIILLIIVLVVFCGYAFAIGLIGNKATNNKIRRTQHIAQFALPSGIFDSLRKHYPDLTEQNYLQVVQGLRQFFRAYLDSDFQYISMPSKVVDDLWHEFILYTVDYEAFCGKAFGRFFHHMPAAALRSPTNMKKYQWWQYDAASAKPNGPEDLAEAATKQSNEGLRRCWWHACNAEAISPETPTRLPLLFELDAKLKIRGGFLYVPKKMTEMRTNKFASDFPISACTLMVLSATDFTNKNIDGSLAGFGSKTNGGSKKDAGCGGGGCGGGGGDGGGGCGGD